MRVLVASTAGAGHFSPLVPVARACLAAGHEVLVAAPASFRDTVGRAGLAHAPFADVDPQVMGEVFGRLASLSQDEADEVVVRDVFGRLDARAALPGVTEIVDSWQPDLVLREPCELASLAVTLGRGVPHAVVAIGVSAMAEGVGRMLAEPLAELDALAGLAPGSCAGAMAAADTFTVVPEALDRSDTVHVRRYREAGGVPPDEPGAGRPWAAPSDGGRDSAQWDPALPLVYVTFGSVTATAGRFNGVYPAVLDALADEPVRVLMTTGHAFDLSTLGAVPGNARVQHWAPQGAVLADARVLVGHGGFGTTMGGVAAGVPQVVMPLFSFDQRLNAEHVAATGAGLAFRGAGDVGLLPEAVRALLAEPSHREAAQALAAEVSRLAPVQDMVPVLETLATQ